MAVWRAMPSPLRLAIVGLGRIATATSRRSSAPAAWWWWRAPTRTPPPGSCSAAGTCRSCDAAGLPPVDAAVVTVPTGAHLAVLRELRVPACPRC